MGDLSIFFMAFLEHLVLHNVHAMNGLAALLLSSDRLTAYHHKLLKLQEKCLVDILTTAINLMIYIETEVLGKDVRYTLNPHPLVAPMRQSYMPSYSSRVAPTSALPPLRKYI